MGIPAVVLPKFDLDRFCGLIQEYQITYASLPPPIILALAKHPSVAKYDLSSVKWLNSGAAPLGRDLVEQVWKRLLIPVMQGYGLSETSPVLTKMNIADWARYNGSCGKLLPNISAKVVDVDTGRELAPGEGEGELWFSGPNVFPGYLNRPELQNDTFSEDGFFKTGDIGYVDTKGNFYITDRLKELIKYSKFFPPFLSLPSKGTHISIPIHPHYTSTNLRPFPTQQKASRSPPPNSRACSSATTRSQTPAWYLPTTAPGKPRCPARTWWCAPASRGPRTRRPRSSPGSMGKSPSTSASAAASASSRRCPRTLAGSCCVGF